MSPAPLNLRGVGDLQLDLELSQQVQVQRLQRLPSRLEAAQQAQLPHHLRP